LLRHKQNVAPSTPRPEKDTMALQLFANRIMGAAAKHYQKVVGTELSKVGKCCLPGDVRVCCFSRMSHFHGSWRLCLSAGSEQGPFLTLVV